MKAGDSEKQSSKERDKDEELQSWAPLREMRARSSGYLLRFKQNKKVELQEKDNKRGNLGETLNRG